MDVSGESWAEGSRDAFGNFTLVRPRGKPGALQARHPKMRLFRKTDQMRNDPGLVSSGHHLSEHNVFSVQLGANHRKITLFTRHSQEMRVADDGKMPLAAVGE